MTIKKRIELLEKTKQRDDGILPGVVIIYDVNIPGDADRKAQEVEAYVKVLIPDNGRNRSNPSNTNSKPSKYPNEIHP